MNDGVDELIVTVIHTFMCESPNECDDPPDKGPAKENIQHQNGIPVSFSPVEGYDGWNKVNSGAY
jgi:hypothetical protein